MMFKKPFKIKSNSQLKGSDRKKLRSDIVQQFPQLTEEELNLIIPSKDTVFQLKVLAHTGEVVIIYTVQKLPIIFELEKVMYPTVYMLWHKPDLLYTFTTHPQVLPVIVRGADLMLPGVVLPNGQGLNAYGRLQKGERVAVNLTSNKAPVAVGMAANSSYDMYMCAKRGKCVQVLHSYGDLLSTYGTKLVVPELGSPFEVGLEQDDSTDSSPSHQSDENQLDEKLARVNEKIELISDFIESSGTETTETPLNGTYCKPKETDVQNAELVKEIITIDHLEETPSSTLPMDDLLKYCFIKSIRTSMKKVDLPLLTSNFYKLHMITACPVGNTLEIKKSSYKKLSNFLEEMAKLGVIQIESLQKGVQRISKIDYNSEIVKGFVDNLTNETDENGLVVDNCVTRKSTVPEITEEYVVTAAVLPLFYRYDYKKKKAVTDAVVQKVVGDYVRVQNLQNPTNRKEIVLDEVLRSATNSPRNVEILSWDQVMSKVFGQMGHSFKVELSGTEMPLSKGKLPPIDIQVGTRSGNKKVTLVNNLELYGINLAEFSRECQYGVAASTTINTLPSAKSAQLQIQGNHTIFVGKMLMEKYQIPNRYLRGLKNAPKKK